MQDIDNKIVNRMAHEIGVLRGRVIQLEVLNEALTQALEGANKRISELESSERGSGESEE